VNTESCQNNDNKINVPLNVIISTDFQFWTLIRVEIIIAINVENCTNIRANFFVILFENCGTNCYNCNFNPCGIFESMTSFTPILNQDLEQGKLMAAVNSPRKVMVQT